LSAKDCINVETFYDFIEPYPIVDFNSKIFKIEDNTNLHGYFQTEKYFINFKNDILNEFTFKKEIKEKAKDIRSITQEPVISVHLRLGDYKNLVDKHPICGIEYYKKALEHIPNDLLIIAFSDEPEIAKNIFNSLNRKYFIVEETDQYIDMCLMTMCDYHIIANSSFSWWGAWLSNTNKVIAPSQWFGNSPEMPKNWSDIYCNDWIII
jgi:hypothetical protein